MIAETLHETFHPINFNEINSYHTPLLDNEINEVNIFNFTVFDSGIEL